MADLVPQLKRTLPAVLQGAGESASERVIEFFTAEIRDSKGIPQVQSLMKDLDVSTGRSTSASTSRS